MPRDKKASSSGDDLISALPDGVLRHVLGFLPADEAVRTTVLAPRWRGLWRSTRRLRIINSEERWKSAQDFNKFVNRLFLLRDPNCALDQIDFSDHSFWGRDGTDINIWIRHALLCRATVLSARFGDRFFHDTVDGPALASRHLKKLGLAYMTLKGNFLDLSSCPALEDLNITNSDLGTHKILSQSVKRLSIKNCTITAKMHISVPSLVWLHLHFIGPLSPSLESMPSLETALVSSIIGRNLQIDQYNHLFLGGRWTATRWVLISKYGLDFIKNQVHILPS